MIHYYNKKKGQEERRTEMKESKAKKRKKKKQKQKHNIQEQIVAKTKLNSCWLNLENIFRHRALVFFYGKISFAHTLAHTHTDTPAESRAQKSMKKIVSEWMVCLSFAFLF